MAVTKDDVRRTARLARLHFSDDEQEQLAGELSRILDYADKLSELDTTGVPPMTHVFSHGAVRSDEVEERISREEALQSAPDTDGAHVRVPAALE